VTATTAIQSVNAKANAAGSCRSLAIGDPPEQVNCPDLGSNDEAQIMRRDGMVGPGNPVQAKVERRPFSYSTLCPNLTSVALNDSLHRCQSYSGSRKILWLVKTLEGPKQLVSVFHIEPGAIVSYEIRHRPISLPHRTKFNSGDGPFAGELPRIIQEVFQQDA
jgi:hypothetical protein